MDERAANVAQQEHSNNKYYILTFKYNINIDIDLCLVLLTFFFTCFSQQISNRTSTITTSDL